MFTKITRQCIKNIGTMTALCPAIPKQRPRPERGGPAPSKGLSRLLLLAKGSVLLALLGLLFLAPRPVWGNTIYGGGEQILESILANNGNVHGDVRGDICGDLCDDVYRLSHYYNVTGVKEIRLLEKVRFLEKNWFLENHHGLNNEHRQTWFLPETWFLESQKDDHRRFLELPVMLTDSVRYLVGQSVFSTIIHDGPIDPFRAILWQIQELPYYLSLPLLNLGGPLPLTYCLNYEIDWWAAEPSLINRFRSNVNPTLNHNQVTITIFLVDEWLTFTFNAGNWELDEAVSVRYVLKETGPDFTQGYYYLMDPIRGIVYIFEKVTNQCGAFGCPGRLVYILDRNNNRHNYTYGAQQLSPDRIDDGLGRRLDFAYNNFNRLATVTDQAGRFIGINYEQNAPDFNNQRVIRSVTDARGNATIFHYNSNPAAIVGVERPLGNIPYTQTVANVIMNGINLGSVTSQTDAFGNTFNLNYDPASNKVTVTHPDNSAVIFEGVNNNILDMTRTDALGNKATFQQTVNRQQISQVIIDRLGNITNINYHLPTGNVASYQSPKGGMVTFTYTAQDQTFTNPANGEQIVFTFYNLTRIDYPDGTSEEFTYDARGNVLTRKDQAGKTRTYTYNAGGRILTETNPEGGVTTYTYNPDGTPASKTDADAGIITYQYDAWKRIAQANYPDGTNYQFAYNANDFIVQAIDRRGVVYRFEYDANNNLARIDRAFGAPIAQAYQYQYDALDRRIRFIDPQGNQVQYAYTYWNGLRRITYPDNARVTFNYDARGWMNQIVDENDKVWEIGRDNESVFDFFNTPTGRHIDLATNEMGGIIQVTDPSNNMVRIDRDDMERIIRVTDRLNREINIDWDGEDRITAVTMPVIGTITCTRNGLGLITRITDQRGNNWDFEYTPMGRPRQIRDPLGNEWNYTYDNMARLARIAYPDGVTETRTYDNNGNLIQRRFSDGLLLTYTYDDLNRLTATGSVPVNITYDNRDQVTNTQMEGADFGATYDNRRRLETVTYDGQMMVAYTWGPRDLITQVTDNRTNSWVRFTYDDDRLLIMVERSNGINTEIERDANGRITRIRHEDKAEMEFTVNAEGEITQILENLPTDVASFLIQELNQYTYDAANQITGAGFAYDARGRCIHDPQRTYTWNSADHLTGLTHGATNISYEYTGQGEVARRTVDGVTTEYFYNYAVKDHPIMAEKRDGGYTRFYVYTPEGLLLYFVDLPDTAYFYHFNHIGTTLFLTDTTGRVTDSYGYSPYGRLMKHEGTSDQPFSYIGRYGVRQEGSTGLYHMRARYYDSLTKRFISRDPLLPDPKNPKSVNPYPYANQNPLSFIDPSGGQCSRLCESSYSLVPQGKENTGNIIFLLAMIIWGWIFYRKVWAGSSKKKTTVYAEL